MSVSTARAFSILPSVPSGLPKLRDSESPPTPPFSTGTDPKEIQDLFDYLTELEVDGMMVSPGYRLRVGSPTRDHFLQAKNNPRALFGKILRTPSGRRPQKTLELAIRVPLCSWTSWSVIH